MSELSYVHSMASKDAEQITRFSSVTKLTASPKPVYYLLIYIFAYVLSNTFSLNNISINISILLSITLKVINMLFQFYLGLSNAKLDYDHVFIILSLLSSRQKVYFYVYVQQIHEYFIQTANITASSWLVMRKCEIAPILASVPSSA